MTYTPLYLSRPTTLPTAKVATPAKALRRVSLARGADFSDFSGFSGPTTLDGEPTERAAIIEEGVGAPREWAEGFARLEARPPPVGVDPLQWLAVVSAAGRFLDEWGAKAAALGWTATDLFGLDPAAPLNRRDQRGAAFYLANAEVLAITAEAISLKVASNVVRLHRRDSGDAPPADVWESL